MPQLVYLGPAQRISPGQDLDGQPLPFVTVGNPIELSDRQVVMLEQMGHSFEGRLPVAGAPGPMTVGIAAPMPQSTVPAPPETVPAPVGARSTLGGMAAPTPEEQAALAENYIQMPNEGENTERRSRRAKESE